MSKLTKRSYHSPKNKYITNSKVGDFLVSKELYKAKHIDGTLPKEVTPSMTLGSMVDLYISTGKASSILKQYHIKVLKAENEEEFNNQKRMVAEGKGEYIVSADMYDKAINMGRKIVESPIYEWYKKNKTKFQVVLTSEYSGMKVAGMLDALTICDGVAYIDDFKTAAQNAIRSPLTWMYHCKDYGYLRQFAHYRQLVFHNFPEVKSIVCRHIVISSSDRDWHPVRIYNLSKINFDVYLKEFISTAFDIVDEKEWTDPKPDFNQEYEMEDFNSPQEMDEDGQDND